MEGATSQYDPLIQEAGAILKRGPINPPHILRAWEDITWNKAEDQRINADVEIARDKSSRITIYPSLLRKPRAHACFLLLREFGHILFKKASEQAQRRWTNKLGLPTSGQVMAVQRKLKPNFKSYHELVESFTTAMDRYVAVNVANALIANGVPYAQSESINLQQWGPTQEYCNRRRYHVLIPLISAYASKEIFEDFGAAFADWVTGMCGITESSVADATHEIIRDIIEAAR